MELLPAAVTPFDAEDRVDLPSFARLLALFRAEGATGVVVGGTTGEGPSLSGFEKRDLVRAAVPLAHGLPTWLGVATPSLEEAVWLAKEAGKAGAAGVLLMPPFFHRDADPAPWLRAFLDRSPVDAILYHFPRLAPPIPLGAMDHPWNISLFHYRNHGADVGRVLAGVQVPPGDEAAFAAFLARVGFAWTDVTEDAACRMFLR